MTTQERKTFPILPLEEGPFAIHLVRSERTSDHEPFVRLGANHSDSRAYLGHLRSAAGVLLQTLVIRLPELGDVPQGESENPPSLLAIDREWRRRHEEAQRFGSASEHFPQLVLPASPGAAHLLSPMIYCRERQRVFVLPCPMTLEPLSTCRDDELLARHELPLYSVAPQALLYNPAAERRGEELTFYVAREEAPPDLASRGVLGLGALRTQLAETFDARQKDGQDLDRSALPSTEEAWWVFTDRDTPYLVTPFFPYDFDRFADYLGGRPTDGLEKGEDPGGEGYLFALEGSGLDAVEILLLKLVFFGQVVEALRVYYHELEPHLDLHPGHLVVDTVPFGEELPRRWGFQVKLLGLSSARPRTLPQDETVMMPPRRAQVPYCSPRVRAACMIQPRQGELVIDRLHPEKECSDRILVQARLRDPNGILPRPGPRDRLTLEWPEALLGRTEPVVARCGEEDSGQHTGELVVLAGPIEMDTETRQRLEQARGLSSPGVRYRIFPQLGVPEDVYSLGVLLLRLLLVNDQQDLSALEPLIDGVPSAAPEGPEDDQEGSLLAALRDHPQRLASRNLFYKTEDREKNRPNALPEELWQASLDLAWCLIGRSGFGLGTDGEFQEDQPNIHLAEVQKRVDGLLRQLRLVLFRRQPQHYEIHSLIAELLAGGVGEA